MSSNFGARVQFARRLERISQGALADRMRMSRLSVNNWENGRQLPLFPALLRLAEVLNVEPEWLAFGHVCDGVSGPASPHADPVELQQLADELREASDRLTELARIGSMVEQYGDSAQPEEESGGESP